MGRRREAPDDSRESPLPEEFRPLDPRRIRAIRQWLEGSRPDDPTLEELREFITWVSMEIERNLARRQPVRDLLALLNAARAEVHALRGDGAGGG